MAQKAHAKQAPKRAVKPSGPSQGARSVSQIEAPPQTIDYSADPILQQIQALALQNNAMAEAANTAARNKALIAFGDPTLGGDANTQSAARQNPFSTTANLARQHGERQTALNQNLNKANLFYSSYRGQQLQKEGTQYLGEQSAASQNLQNYLGGLSQNLLAAKQRSQAQVIQAEQDAYNRALANSLKYGGVGKPATQTWRQRFRPPVGVR